MYQKLGDVFCDIDLFWILTHVYFHVNMKIQSNQTRKNWCAWGCLLAALNCNPSLKWKWAKKEIWRKLYGVLTIFTPKDWWRAWWRRRLVLLSSCGRPFTISSHCQLHPLNNEQDTILRVFQDRKVDLPVNCTVKF